MRQAYYLLRPRLGGALDIRLYDSLQGLTNALVAEARRRGHEAGNLTQAAAALARDASREPALAVEWGRRALETA